MCVINYSMAQLFSLNYSQKGILFQIDFLTNRTILYTYTPKFLFLVTQYPIPMVLHWYYAEEAAQGSYAVTLE